MSAQTYGVVDRKIGRTVRVLLAARDKSVDDAAAALIRRLARVAAGITHLMVLATLGLMLFLAASSDADGTRYVHEPWGACTYGSSNAACADPPPVDQGEQLAVLARAEKANAAALRAALREHRDCRVTLPSGTVPGSFLVRTADAQLRPTVRRLGWSEITRSGGWVVASCA